MPIKQPDRRKLGLYELSPDLLAQVSDRLYVLMQRELRHERERRAVLRKSRQRPQR